MTAPPTVDATGDQEAPEHSRRVWRNLLARSPSSPELDDLDPTQTREDPAGGVVGVGERPVVRAPVTARGRFRTREMPTDRLRGWVVTLVLTLVGGFLRIWNVGGATDGIGTGPAATPLFDEKYYAVEAAEVLRNHGVEDNQGFGLIVHPPLGKQLIAIGEWLFGYNSFGWRFASVIAGTLVVLITVRAARRLTRSTLLSGIAGVLIICDGVSQVMARAALLDIFQETFIIAAFACLLCDRDQVRARLAAAVEDGSILAHKTGVALGARWWRFGCGLFIGLTTAIKWNGVYWIVGFGLMTVIWDITARREVGIRGPVRAVARRDLIGSLWALAVLPILTYVASWWAWLSSEDAFPRHVLLAANTGDWTGTPLLQKIASLWNNSLWQWTWQMLHFHSTLDTPVNPADRHPWESKPPSWPMSLRPLLTYVGSNLSGCGTGTNNCSARIFIVGTPMMWWLSLFVTGWALWKCIARLDWRYAAVLVAYGSGYIPWYFNLDRQMYFFYVTPLAPFLTLGITLVLGDILGRSRAGVERRFAATAVVSIYLGLVVANFIWIMPILDGRPITAARLTALTIIPSWG